MAFFDWLTRQDEQAGKAASIPVTKPRKMGAEFTGNPSPEVEADTFQETKPSKPKSEPTLYTFENTDLESVRVLLKNAHEEAHKNADTWTPEQNIEATARVRGLILREKALMNAPQEKAPAIQTVFDSSGTGKHVDQALLDLRKKLRPLGMDDTAKEYYAPNLLMQFVTVTKNAAFAKQLIDIQGKAKTQQQAQQRGGGGEELPEERERRAVEDKYIHALQGTMRAPELKDFWGVALFFLTSLVMGVKNASMLFFRKHQDGSLQAEVGFWKGRLEAADRRERSALDRTARSRQFAANFEQRQQFHDQAATDRVQSAYQRQDNFERTYALKLASFNARGASADEKAVLDTLKRAHTEAWRKADSYNKQMRNLDPETQADERARLNAAWYTSMAEMQKSKDLLDSYGEHILTPAK